jgi:hypothetical protein
VSASTPEQDPFGAITTLLRLALCNNVFSGVASPPTPDVPADRSHAESGTRVKASVFNDYPIQTL